MRVINKNKLIKYKQLKIGTLLKGCQKIKYLNSKRNEFSSKCNEATGAHWIIQEEVVQTSRRYWGHISPFRFGAFAKRVRKTVLF